MWFSSRMGVVLTSGAAGWAFAWIFPLRLMHRLRAKLNCEARHIWAHRVVHASIWHASSCLSDTADAGLLPKTASAGRLPRVLRKNANLGFRFSSAPGWHGEKTPRAIRIRCTTPPAPVVPKENARNHKQSGKAARPSIGGKQSAELEVVRKINVAVLAEVEDGAAGQ